MPFVFLDLYNKVLGLVPKSLQSTWNVDEKMYWERWEEFNAVYDTFRNNLFVALGFKRMKLGDYYKVSLRYLEAEGEGSIRR